MRLEENQAVSEKYVCHKHPAQIYKMLFFCFFVGHFVVYCFGGVDGHTLNKASP